MHALKVHALQPDSKPEAEPNQFRTLWNLGYRRLVPIIPPGAPVSPKSSLHKRIAAGKDSRGKSPGYRGTDGLWRGFDWLNAETSEDLLDVWHAMGAGVGIKTGDQGDGTSLVAIDADTLDKDQANAVYREIVRTLLNNGVNRKKLPIRVGREPKALYLIRVGGHVPYQYVEFDGREGRERVELLTDGRQFVAHGVHPGTMQPYDWRVPLVAYDQLLPLSAGEEPLPLSVEELKKCLAAIVSALPNARHVISKPTDAESGEPVNQDRLRGELDLVRSAIEALPNEHATFPHRGDVIAMACALKASLPDQPDEALELLHVWGEKWVGPNGETNDPAWLDVEWATLKPPFRVGADWIYQRAEKHGGWTGQHEKWFEALAPDVEGAISPGTEEAANTLRFISMAEAVARARTTPMRPLIKDVLGQHTMSVIYGDSNVGKTFVALDMGHAVATGRLWAGKPTTQTGVAYIAAEGGRGIYQRIAALGADRGLAENFFLLVSPVNLLRPDADLQPLVAEIEALPVPIGLVIIDTLSRVLAGGDENSSVDMGALVRHLTAIQTRTDAHVMTIHHTGKNAARGARGHSLLRAALDTELEMVAATEANPGLIRATKQRDVELGFEVGFRLRDRLADEDDQGLMIKSAVVDITPFNEPTPNGAGAADKAAVRSWFAGTSDESWRADVRAKGWIGGAIARSMDLDEEADQRRIQAMIGQLVRDGSIMFTKRRVPKTRRQAPYFVRVQDPAEVQKPSASVGAEPYSGLTQTNSAPSP